TVFAGLENALNTIQSLRFTADDLEFLRSQGLNEKFINSLRDFRFRGSIHAAREGELVFPNEPILRVESTILEAQLIETYLLNMLNFQSLIATKAARMRLVAGNRIL